MFDVRVIPLGIHDGVASFYLYSYIASKDKWNRGLFVLISFTSVFYNMLIYSLFFPRYTDRIALKEKFRVDTHEKMFCKK